MADMRSCSKMSCRWPAAATLSYRYATAEVWLSDLGEGHPATHDLCPHHADDLRVPRGWTLVDDRCPAEAVHEPSAAEIVERVTTLRRSVDAMLDRQGLEQQGGNPQPASRSSRYTALLDSLPTYDPPEAEDAEGAGSPAAVPAPAVLVPVGVSHEMAPIVREFTRAQPARRDDADTGPADADAHAAGSTTTAEGSPDEDPHHETGLRGAVVLSLPLRTPGGHDDGGVG